MNIALTSKLKQSIKMLVDFGFYNNTSEFVREAVRQKLYEENIQRLRMELIPAKQQMLQGKKSKKSFATILKEAKAKYEK